MLEFLERLFGPGFVLMSYAYARSEPGHPVAVTQAVPVLKSVGALVGGSEAADESDRSLSGRDQLPEYVLGGARSVPGGRQRSWLERSEVQTGRPDED